ncbi:MAG: ASPIC/UnbV domain-containing protein [Verrucomicrobiales bacterium]
MLSDPTKSEAFRQSGHWRSPLLNFQLRVKQVAPSGLGETEGPEWRSHSFSGHERNRLLLGGAGGFADHSLVSGVDCREDARGFSLLDFDADGWVDIALMSTHAPQFRLFRNRLGEITKGGRVLTLRLEGANRDAAGSDFSPRDAVGALVTVITSSGRRAIRRSAGEGLASQNSAGLRITLSPGESVREIDVRWPSGRTSTHRPGGRDRSIALRESEEERGKSGSGEQ